MITAKHQAVFDDIYKTAAWGIGSGPGSDPRTASFFINFVRAVYLAAGPSLVELWDIGCGDGRVGSAILAGLNGSQYVGVDPSKTALDLAVKNLEGCPAVFYQEQPKSRVGSHAVVIIKDVFQHLSESSIKAILDYVSSCQAIVVCNDTPSESTNRRCEDGGYRPFSLRNEGLLPIAELTWQADPHEKTIEVFDGRTIREWLG